MSIPVIRFAFLLYLVAGIISPATAQENPRPFFHQSTLSHPRELQEEAKTFLGGFFSKDLQTELHAAVAKLFEDGGRKLTYEHAVRRLSDQKRGAWLQIEANWLAMSNCSSSDLCALAMTDQSGRFMWQGPFASVAPKQNELPFPFFSIRPFLITP